MVHPVIRTLHSVTQRLRQLTSNELEQVALAAGLTRRGLWRSQKDGWEPKPTQLAALDAALQVMNSTPARNNGTPVPDAPQGANLANKTGVIKSTQLESTL